MDNLRTVILSGELGRKFGKYHKLAVNSPAEAVKALSVNIKDFKKELISSKDRGITYAVFSGKNNISKEELTCGSGDGEAIKIVPIVTGSKRAGLLQTIVGAVLVVVGFFTSWTGGTALMAAGFAMMAGGVIQMLSPQQKASIKDQVDNGTSYNFNGAVNTSVQGINVPMLYGRMVVGSAVISAGLYSEDKQ